MHQKSRVLLTVLFLGVAQIASAAFASHLCAVEHSSTQAGSANTSNYDLTISVTNSELATVANGGHVQSSSGYDIQPFYDSGLTTPFTNWELVKYDPTGYVEIHALQTTLDHTTNGTVCLGFNDASITMDGSSTATWPSKYKFVGHLKSASSLTDSTSNASTVTPSGGVADATGAIDGGVAFVRTSSQYLDLGNPSALQLGTFYARIWYKPSSVGIVQTPLSKWNSGTGQSSWILYIGTDNKANCLVNAGGSVAGATSTGTVSSGTWSLLICAYDGSNVAVGINDVIDATGKSGTLFNATAHVFVGQNEATNYADGIGDEVIITDTTPTQSELTATWNNEKPGSTFLDSWTCGGTCGGGGGSVNQGVVQFLMGGVGQ